jgi:hypothetical protein
LVHVVFYLVWLHHPVAVGRLRPTLIRARLRSSAKDTTAGAVEKRCPAEETVIGHASLPRYEYGLLKKSPYVKTTAAARGRARR